MQLYKSDIFIQLTSSTFPAAVQFLPCSLWVVFAVSKFFTEIFSSTLCCILSPVVLSTTRCLFRAAPISQNLLQKVSSDLDAFKKCHKLHIMKLKCFPENKQITIFLMNLNCNWNAFRCRTKIIFRTSKRRLKDVLFYWDKWTNFERTKDVYFRSRAD